MVEDDMRFPIGQSYIGKIRSSRPEVFLGKGVQKICSKFTGEFSISTLLLIKENQQPYFDLTS